MNYVAIFFCLKTSTLELWRENQKKKEKKNEASQTYSQAVFRSNFQKIYKIPRHIESLDTCMGALNVGKKIINCTVCL
jgi:predicted nuclease with RNAse H fold